jgi:phosphoribosyl-ATP pyrophosphohydrolase
MNDDTLQQLFKTLVERRDNPSEGSYTSTLLAKGVDRILKKVGEEATELVIASKGGERGEIVCETADLLYHTLVLLVYHDIPLDEVYGELSRRFGMSGLAEKAARIK